jgi:hypothetical protein
LPGRFFLVASAGTAVAGPEDIGVIVTNTHYGDSGIAAVEYGERAVAGA